MLNCDLHKFFHGPYTITATIAVGTGLGNYAISYLPGTLNVSKDGTSTTTATTASSTSFGQSVTLTATVTVQAPASGPPTGSVDFVDTTTGNDLTPGGVALTAGSASFSIAILPVGTRSITETYSGDGNFLTSNGSDSQSVVISIYVLSTATTDPHGVGALDVATNSKINIPGTLIDDSSASPAITVSGTSSITAASIRSVGSVQILNSSTISPTPWPTASRPSPTR